MEKKEFDRNKPRVNIGGIGGHDNVTHFERVMAMELFHYFEGQGAKYKEQLLSELIEKYGIKDGYEKYLEIIDESEFSSDIVSYRKGKK